MSNLILPGTEDTPGIHFDKQTGEYSISGRSLPEDVSTFYAPVFSWLDSFAGDPAPSAVFVFKLEYFNTASSKIILDILMRLEELHSDGKSAITIEWHYFESDEDMQEAGEEYKDLVEVPFVLKAYA